MHRVNSTKTKQPKAFSLSDYKNWLPLLDPVPVVWIFGSPIVALLGALFWQFQLRTFLLAFIGYYIGGVGITMGYHRLWSHRSYEASWPVKFLLLICGTSAFEGSVINWCVDHRAHHRYPDTEKDPYSVTRGFWWAHVGWVLWKRDVKEQKTEYPDCPVRNPLNIDISDLMKDPMLRFQHQYYAYLAVLTGLIVPTCIAGLYWNDWVGGFFIAGFAKSVFLQHCTFFINSLAHTWGSLTYSDCRTAKDSYIVALLTFGEGYHNFHHEFPYDYRNGLSWYDYDPGKWLISALSYVGLTFNLKKFPGELFAKGKIQVIERQIEIEKAKYNWGKKITELPTMTMQQYKSRVAEGSSLILIDGIVHDVANFMDEHPGGKSYLKNYLGLDASNAFNGKVYDHSNAARNVLATQRVAKLIFDQKSA